ncbi:MAG: hypothetical protein ABI277_11400 [Burkholderiaceae bacterium]
MGKFILYGLLVVGASSLTNWVSLGKSTGSSYSRGGGWIGGTGGGWSSSGGGHK